MRWVSGPTRPPRDLMMMNLTDESKQGAALGACTSFWDLRFTIRGAFTAAVAACFGYPAVFVFGAPCPAAAVAVSPSIRQSKAQPAAAS